MERYDDINASMAATQAAKGEKHKKGKSQVIVDIRNM